MAYRKKNYGLIERLTITATSGGTLTLANNSRTYQQLTGTSAHTVTLPQANASSPNNCPLSLEFVIMNRSTGAVTVNYFGGTLAKTIAAGSQATFHLVDNSTSTGTWDVTNESGGGSGQATLSALEKLGALAALGNMLYEDSESVSSQLRVSPEEIGGQFWRTRTSLPSVRSAHCGFTVGGHGYVNGGYTNNGNPLGTIINTTERFDETNDFWLSRAATATSAFDRAGFELGGFGYLAGGQISAVPTTNTEKYNPTLNTWATVALIGTATEEMFGLALNGFGWAGGGWNGSAAVATVQNYSDTLNAWYIRAPLPTVKFGLTGDGVVIDGAGYTSGGHNGSVYVSNNYKLYDSINAWYTMQPLTLAKGYSSRGAISGMMVSAGGNTGSLSSNVQEYTPASDIWVNRASLSAVRSTAGRLMEISGLGFLSGGDNGTVISSVEQYVAHTFYLIPITKKSLSVPTSVLVGTALSGLVTSLPVRLRSDGNSWKHFEANKDSSLKTGESVSGKFLEYGLGYVNGGDNGTTPNTNNYMYNSVTDSWITKAVLPQGKSTHMGISLGGKGYAIGGVDTGFSSVATTAYAFDDITNSFTSKSNTPTAKRNLRGFALNGFGYAISGMILPAATDPTCYKYNPTLDSWSSITAANVTVVTQTCQTINGRGMKIGGTTTSNGGAAGATGVSELYSDITGAWTTVASVPTNQYEPQSFSIEQFVYTAGGHNGSGFSTNSYKYDPAANSWSSIAANLTAFIDSGTFVLGGLGYQCGGIQISPSTQVQQYNPLSNVWANKAVLPTNTEFAAQGFQPGAYRNFELQVGVPTYLQAIGSYQFITRANMNGAHSNGAGGGHIDGKSWVWDSTGNLNRSEYHNHDTNTWTTWLNFLNIFAGGAGSFVIGGIGFVVNGQGGTTQAADVFLGTQRNMSAAPANVRFRVLQSASHSLNGFGWWYGGDQNNSVTMLPSIDQYNPNTNVWTQRATANTNFVRYSAGFNYNGLIYVIGGNDVSSFGQQTDRYSDGSNTWTLRANYPFGVTGASTTTVGGFPVVIGGWNGAISSSVYRYSDTLNTYTAQTNFVGGGRENQLSDQRTGLLYGGDAGVSADNLSWKYIPAIQNVLLGAGLRIS